MREFWLIILITNKGSPLLQTGKIEDALQAACLEQEKRKLSVGLSYSLFAHGVQKG